MTDMTPPHDADAELALLGRVYTFGHEYPEAAKVVDPSDLYVPAHQTLWQAFADLHASGRKFNDPITLADHLRAAGTWDRIGGQGKLAEMMGAFAPSWAGAADIVVKLAQYRRILATAWQAIQEAQAAPGDPLDLRDQLTAALADMHSPTDDGRPIPGLDTWGAALDREVADIPWAIDGIIRIGHRALIVAGEGTGKTVLLRQLALSAEAGCHPFTRLPLQGGPVHTLTVDLENPAEQVTQVGRLIANAIHASGYPKPGDADLWERPAGIDIRNRRDRLELDRVLTRSQPELVVMGPVYKLYQQRSGEPEELVIREVQHILDDLRTRHGFALVLEHHAPHATSGHRRDLRPIGSSAWLRWPELGRSLDLEIDDLSMQPRYTFGSFRGDRVKVHWPLELRRGLDRPPWPFDVADWGRLGAPEPGWGG